MSKSPEDTDMALQYRLPPLVEAVQKSWLASCGSSTMLSALLTLVSVHLWSFFKNASFSEAGKGGPPFVALIILSYCSIILNMSSTVTSMILTDKLGDLPIYASRRKTYTPEGDWFAGGSLELLECFGTGRSWTWTMWHWIFTLITGIWCLLAEIMLYIWIVESPTTRIFMLCLGVFATMPMLQLLPLHCFSSSDTA